MRPMVAVLLLALSLPALAQSPPTPAVSPARAEADSLFRAGRFAAADRAYAAILASDPNEPTARRRRGAIALFGNRLDEARRWLAPEVASHPRDSVTRRVLVDVLTRQDDFAEAAVHLHALGRTAFAKKLESFAGARPYRFDRESAVVPFVRTDPLPVIETTIHGRPATLIIDTGGGELIVDRAFADSAGIAIFGADSARYAGDRRAVFHHGRVDSITLGGMTVRDVPVHVQDTRAYAAAAGGRRVDGILGTVFLGHFLATLDYPGGRLVLRRRGATPAAAGAIAIPFWMSGDHILVADGAINGKGPLLWFVDTGLAGAGFTCPAATMADGGIPIPPDSGLEGTGGGGRVKIAPFTVDSLSLGPIGATQVFGLYGPFPASLEYGQGYRIAGIVSHAFLRPYRMTIDFDRMELRFEKP